MSRATLNVLVAVVLSTAVAGQAGAATSLETRVAIISPRADHPLMEHLLGELVYLGYLPVVVTHEGGKPSSAEVGSIIRSARATSGIIVQPVGQGARLWVETAGGQPELVDIPADRGGQHRLTAVRVVELLRANTPSQLLADSTIHAAVRRYALRLAGGPTFSPGGLSAMGHLWLSGGWRPLRWLELELLLMGPVAPGRVQASEGKANVYAGLAGFGANALLLSWWKRFSLEAGLGLGASFVYMQGQAQPPLVDASDWVVSGLGYAKLGIGVGLTRWLRLRLDTLVGFTVPRPVVTFAEREAASWGRPLIALALGLELSR